MKMKEKRVLNLHASDGHKLDSIRGGWMWSFLPSSGKKTPNHFCFPTSVKSVQSVSSVETESIQSAQMCVNIYSDRNDFSFNVLLPTRHIQTWKYFTETNLIQTVIWLQCEYYRMSSSEHYVRVSIGGLYYCLYRVTTNCSLLQRCVCFMSLCVPSGSGPCTLQ